MATLDLLTQEEARVAVHRSRTPNALDSDIFEKATEVAGQIDDLCGPVVARSVTERHDGAGSTFLLLRETPVLTVEVVLVDGVELDPSGYDLDAQGHYVRLFRRSGTSDIPWPCGNRNIEVTYAAGRFATTAEVDQRWKGFARSALKLQWQQEAPVQARQEDWVDDAGEVASYVSIEDMAKRRMPTEMKPPGCA